MNDLFGAGRAARTSETYTAKDIEVLEGLDPVRRRPGMYIGGVDETAMHHLASEIIDNAMDEAVAGHASLIEVKLEPGNILSVRDNGRGIPIDPHPKFRDRSALEVILTTLHSGAKFGSKAYATSGGLHGVGSSVVNALSELLEVEVAKDRTLYKQSYQRGVPKTKLVNAGPVQNRRGTAMRFKPDPQIFGALQFKPARLYRFCRSKAYLFGGVQIKWSCDASLLAADSETPAEALLHFPGGLRDSLADELGDTAKIIEQLWAGQVGFAPGDTAGRMEWALTWIDGGDGFLNSYCNTIPTPQGGTHEAGLRAALTKGIRAWGEHRNNKRAAQIMAEDILASLCAKLSVFLPEPQFQGQTKEKLASPEAAKLVEAAMRDRFDHFLASDTASADALLAHAIDRAEERARKRDAKDVQRKSATRRLRLPGKLTDCTREGMQDTEIFLVEGDSAGGSAKQARNRETQAVLPLRGKILNVASASVDKLRQNQELRDLVEALGCGAGGKFDHARLRYGRVIIMTDADVDGAHIASLLITFFYRELPELIRRGHLFLAQPPLYRLTHGAKSVYAMDDADRARQIKLAFKPGAEVEISRFKGLGEMPAATLRETTMDPAKRTLLKVIAPPDDTAATEDLVEQLMGRRPELRFQFIQANAGREVAIDL